MTTNGSVVFFRIKDTYGTRYFATASREALLVHLGGSTGHPYDMDSLRQVEEGEAASARFYVKFAPRRLLCDSGISDLGFPD